MEATTKRVNGLRKEGKKASVERRVQTCVRKRERKALEKGGKNAGRTGEQIREWVLNSVKPVVETKSMKRAGRAQQVPTPVSERRGRYRAITWIREATLKRAKKSGIAWGDARRKELRRLYDELERREKGRSTGKTIASEPLEMRNRVHRAAKANRVFASRR
jgi:ribosomal protein S7